MNGAFDLGATKSKAWTKENLAWAAGFIDGEGNIRANTSAGRVYPQVVVQVAQKETEPLERLHSIFGGNIYGPDKKGIYNWTVTNFEGAQAVMAAIWHQLTDIKRQQVVDTLTTAKEAWNNMTDKQKARSLWKQAGRRKEREDV